MCVVFVVLSCVLAILLLGDLQYAFIRDVIMGLRLKRHTGIDLFQFFDVTYSNESERFLRFAIRFCVLLQYVLHSQQQNEQIIINSLSFRP